jgi:hypothetical protein
MHDSAQDYPETHGSCQCGAVRFAIAAGPAQASLCHCRMCQRASGNAFVPLYEVPGSRVTWSGAHPAEWASSNISQRGFCPGCGTPLYLRTGETFEFMAGCLSPGFPFRPTEQAGMEARRDWLDTLPHLPGHATRPEWLDRVISCQSKDD